MNSTRIASSAGLRKRLELLRATSSFQLYEKVRARVLRMLELEARVKPDGPGPGGCWRGQLSNMQYLFDASPLVIEKLRHHCYHLTGLGVRDYLPHRERDRTRLAEKLAALTEVGGRDLLVPESALLGGFGFEVDGALFNHDTLKFYEALIALKEGAVLGELRSGQGRKVVWEVGAGWGGFAYQLKLLCPGVTYIITDYPELFLFSAVYLLTHFPDARVAFYGEEPPERLFGRWRELDFIFVPGTALEETRLERVDLTLSLRSFQAMTAEQTRAYVRRAFELDSTYLYSLDRGRSDGDSSPASVRAVIGERYWPHEIEVLPKVHPVMLDLARQPDTHQGGGRAPREYHHLVGWKRLRT